MSSCNEANATLGIDEACFTIVNSYNRLVTFYTIVTECFLCSGVPRLNISAKSNESIVIPTKYPLHIYYKANYQYCHTTYNFKEHGVYGWNLSQEALCSDIYVIREPDNAYFPLLVVFLILAICVTTLLIKKLIIKAVRRCLQRYSEQVHDDLERLQKSESPVQPLNRTTITKFSTRIQSVDAFRGITILLMIFVNNGGGHYYFFNHSTWFGLTVADLVLPWFAWIMGVTITISKRSELRVTTSRIKIILRTLQRSLILILLGLLVNSQSNGYLTSLRFPGVLQLLAVTYFICSTIETIFMKMHLEIRRFPILRDILNNWIQWLIVIVLLVIHTLITFLLPVSNCPRGYLGPGGYQGFSKYSNCTGGAAGYIDRLVFGNHMYSKTDNPVYGTILPHDPEGIMNTLSAVFIVYMGVHAGKILLIYYQCASKISRWLLWAVIIGIIAGILCNFEQNGGIIPVSKKMMSLSFVLTTSSFAFIMLALLHFLIDYKQVWNGAPFVYAGANSIFLYIGHVLTMDKFPWYWKMHKPTHTTQLIINIWTTTLWSIIAYILYKKDIIISV